MLIIIIIVMLNMKKIIDNNATIKILFTINSLEEKKKTIHSKHYLQFLSI